MFLRNSTRDTLFRLAGTTFQTGYILCRRDDAIWFLALPFASIAVALAIQHWLPAIALVSITLLITAPHHFVTWLRTYGIREERERWKTRLLFGPLILIAIVTAGVTWAPVTLAIFAILWDHQHSIMRQYGFTISKLRRADLSRRGLTCR